MGIQATLKSPTLLIKKPVDSRAPPRCKIKAPMKTNPKKLLILIAAIIGLLLPGGMLLKHFQKQAQNQRDLKRTNAMLKLMISRMTANKRELDKNLKYRPWGETHKNCPAGSIIKSQPLPWDNKGHYPVFYTDIKILCKKAGEKIIVAVGDSMTGGVASSPGNTYPELLEKRLKNTRVINAGLNGANTTHWAKGGVLYEKILTQNRDQIDAILFILGGNDGLYSTWLFGKKPDVPAINKRLNAILVNIVKDFPNAKVYVANYPRVRDRSPEMVELMETMRAGQVPGTLAGPDFPPHFMGKSELFMLDYLHLNTSGYNLMANLWAQRLRKDGFN